MFLCAFASIALSWNIVIVLILWLYGLPNAMQIGAAMFAATGVTLGVIYTVECFDKRRGVGYVWEDWKDEDREGEKVKVVGRRWRF